MYSDAPDITSSDRGIRLSPIRCLRCMPWSRRSLRRSAANCERYGGPYCGSSGSKSHVLHVSPAARPRLPDYESAIHMAQDHRRSWSGPSGSRSIGNQVMTVLGGGDPSGSTRVGGFYKTPTRADLDGLVEELQGPLDACGTWCGFIAPYFSGDRAAVRVRPLRHPDEYPSTGRIVSSKGLDIANTEWNDWFVEEHVERSNALHSRIRSRRRLSRGAAGLLCPLNRDLLHPEAVAVANEVGLPAVVTNPFRSITVRAVETVHAIAEALDIIDRYEKPLSGGSGDARRGAFHDGTEAPRGLLYHRGTR